MFKPNQIVEMKWNSRNKEYYISKGYEYNGMFQPFKVKLEDLSKGAKVRVKVICDYCGKEIEKPYAHCLKQRGESGKDCCKECSSIKQKELFLKHYGVENPSQIDFIKEKRLQTYLDKYGVLNPSQVLEFQEKRKTTYLERYGVDHPMKSEIIQQHSRETCLGKYGVEYYFQTDEFKNINKQYWIENYGVENPMGVPEFRNKILESFSSNGSAPTSKMQQKVSNIVGEIYGVDNVTNDVPYAPYLLDMILKWKGYQINIEYDGWYWHKDNQEYDDRRNQYLIQRGYKVLRIRSNYELPTKEQIIEGVDYLVKGNHHLCYIDLDI